VHDGNRGIGQRDAGVEFRNRRIVPFRDLAEEDLGDGRTIESKFAGLDAGQVQDWNDGAVDDWKLNEVILRNIFRRQRHVRRAKCDGLVGDLLDAPARADRLVVEADVGRFLVGIGPFGEDRIYECGAGASQVFGGGGKDRRSQQAGDGNRSEMFQASLLSGEFGRRGSLSHAGSSFQFGRFLCLTFVGNALR